MPDLKRLSKFLALMLRHEADQFGLVLDEHGFTDLERVWAHVEQRYGRTYQRQDLTDLLTSEAGRQRYQLQGDRIRALYGHSQVTPIEYERAIPPAILYHGTTPQAAESIRQQGLRAQQRQYVHLSTSIDRAIDVAGRHGNPVLLVIRALEAHHAGIAFYHPEDQHYLVESLPPEYIDFSQV
ncbi:MAG: RNA 2'-phosphotransferase [Anaerolineae bacterium]|nr:RNA 2'-phosphotransferase [Anaerolineae bacterium]